ncbi:hypothetical protein N9L68_05235 [bacterium]|nr:hypothetical protein [bacterium]
MLAQLPPPAPSPNPTRAEAFMVARFFCVLPAGSCVQTCFGALLVGGSKSQAWTMVRRAMIRMGCRRREWRVDI